MTNADVLGYADYRNFEQVIGKARLACFNSGQRIEDHFVDITEMIGSVAQNGPSKPCDHFAHISKMVDLGSGAKREIEDTQPCPRIMFFRLTRRL